MSVSKLVRSTGSATATMVVSTKIMKKPRHSAHSAAHGRTSSLTTVLPRPSPRSSDRQRPERPDPVQCIRARIMEIVSPPASRESLRHTESSAAPQATRTRPRQVSPHHAGASARAAGGPWGLPKATRETENTALAGKTSQLLGKQRDLPTGQHHVHLTFRQTVVHLVDLLLGLVVQLELRGPGQGFHDIFQHQRITGVDPVVVGRIGELQSQDAEVRQVLPMDTGEGRGDDRSEEHTSELQSRGHLVCRLLLEKN